MSTTATGTNNDTNTRPTPPRGLPILSGPPPITESASCRQCGKEFNVLWRRKHACGHCGYEYCSSCLSDGQALMPRKAGQPSTGAGALAEIKDALGIDDRRAAVGGGYEVEEVCLYCLGMLQVTAATLPILRSLPIKRLKDYLAAYNIPCVGPKEKEDFVQAVVKAKNPTTGCLSPEAESYYRRQSVPKLGHFPTRIAAGTPTARARPSPPTQARPPSQSYARPPSSTNARPPPPSYARPQHTGPSPSRTPPAQARPPPQPRPRPPPSPAPPQSSTPARQPSPPVPTILSLVSLPISYLASLSIGTLKAILYENHVRVDFKQVLEKNELIARVSELVVDERKRLERQRLEEERLANPVSTPAPAPTANGEASSDLADDAATLPENGEAIEAAAKISVPTGPMPEVDRGLCVVCQDEEATLAVVDCGHLCMCPHCSDLIMATSQECPLCRTRIITKHRLIRIYRT